MISDLGSRLLHPNHFLLIRMKEKIIQLHKKQQQVLNSGEEAAQQRDLLRHCLEQQVKWFGEITQVMAKVDPPADVWNDTLAKLKKDLARVQEEKCPENGF